MKQATLTSYIVGFISSIVLTLTAYFAVVTHLFSSWGLLAAILALAMVQLVIQLLFFLHLGSSSGEHSQLAVFFSTISLVLIIVLGSLWIMNHLNYNMMASPAQMEQYIQSQQGGF